MSAIGTLNLVARTNTTFDFSGQVITGTTPINFTDYTAIFTARSFAGSPTIWVQLNTPTDINLTSDGFVEFTIARSIMATIMPNSGKYDLVLRNPSGEDEYVLEGDFIVTPAVTTNE